MRFFCIRITKNLMYKEERKEKENKTHYLGRIRKENVAVRGHMSLYFELR